jgi:hypothetical protein
VSVVLEVALVILFVVVGMAVVLGAMSMLFWWLDRSCQRCLRDEPDNPFCCE